MFAAMRRARSCARDFAYPSSRYPARRAVLIGKDALKLDRVTLSAQQLIGFARVDPTRSMNGDERAFVGCVERERQRSVDRGYVRMG